VPRLLHALRAPARAGRRRHPQGQVLQVRNPLRYRGGRRTAPRHRRAAGRGSPGGRSPGG